MDKEFLHDDLKKENDEYSDNTMISNMYTTTNNIVSAANPYNMDDFDMDEIIIHEEDTDQFYDTDTDEIDTMSTTTTSSSISTETEVYIDSLKNRNYFKVTKENSISFEELLDLMRSRLLRNNAKLLNNEENIVDADVIKVNDDIIPETVGVKGSDQRDQVN